MSTGTKTKARHDQSSKPATPVAEPGKYGKPSADMTQREQMIDVHVYSQ